MTQKDKDLLLKDLCTRLPYGVIVETPKGKGHVCDINLTIFCNEVGVNINPTSRDKFNAEDVKPYLFPLSSMTEEQKKEFKEISKCKDEIEDYSGFDSKGVYLIEIGKYEYEYDTNTTVEEFYFNEEIIDWLNENHFDYRGLIPMNLANDATGLNIY